MRLVTAATAKPVTLAELRDVLYIINTAEHDTRLGLALDAAIAKVEADTGRILAPTVYSERFPEIPQKIVRINANYYQEFWLGVGPITAVGSVTVDGQSVSTAAWLIGSASPRDSAVYAPQSLSGDMFIQFTAGYSSCPADIKRAVVMLATAYFQNPLGQVEAKDVAGYNAIISPYTRWLA